MKNQDIDTIGHATEIIDQMVGAEAIAAYVRADRNVRTLVSSLVSITRVRELDDRAEQMLTALGIAIYWMGVKKGRETTK